MKNSTQHILMVRPASFGLNIQTVEDNKFQKKLNLSELEVLRKALEEFELYTIKLKESGIDVIIVNDTKEPIKPDAIYPNNWFSTHSDGKVFLYPMKALNRRFERHNPVIEHLNSIFDFKSIIDLTNTEENEQFLEGTGSIVFNHIHKIAYASISKRTDKDLFLDFCKRIHYTPITFNSYDKNGDEIYHTNVMMSVTSEFTIICLESISDIRQKEELQNHLNSFAQNIIDVTYEQMEQFCCNVLEVQNESGKVFLTMSERAYNSFSQAQKNVILKTHSIIHSPLYTIEDIGGGGSRCMMAEIYLPKK